MATDEKKYMPEASERLEGEHHLRSSHTDVLIDRIIAQVKSADMVCISTVN